MKNTLCKLAVALCLATALRLHGQGVVYDQQSDTTPEKINYDTFDLYKMTLYESFVPTFSSIGVVQLEISDYLDSNTSGATMSVALFSGSPENPTFLGGTERVYLPPDFNNDQLTFSGVTNFYFSTPVALTPGQTYYLSPVELTGDNVWSVAVLNHTYPYGQLYGGGYPFTPPVDLWFREGIVATPEPSDLALLAMGGLLVAGIFGLKGKTQQLKAQHTQK